MKAKASWSRNANCILLETSDDAVLNNRAVELITLLNPSAELFRSGDSAAFEQCVLEKPGLQNWIAKGGSGWLRLLGARGTSASSTGFVFRSRLPFHPQRLWEALDGPLRDIFRLLSSDELLEGTDKWLNIPNPFNPRTFERPKNQGKMRR